ncbi:MAG: aminopeptidase [Chitinispirillaceae bacterium]
MRFFRLLTVLSLLFMLNSCYVVKQGVSLLKYQWRAQSIDKMLQEEDLSADLEEFLLLVKEIRSFAMDTLGLKKNNNYTKYVRVDRDYMVDVVVGSRADTFDTYNWWFPFFGKFPYKGFFNKEDAQKEAEKLHEKGYDVIVRKADAFSTLGFFSDPVYSFMKDYTVFGLASLIIHEQMHATLFVKNEIEFNEELATFVGNEGGLLFVRKKFGGESDQYRTAVLALKDRETYTDLLRSLYNELKEMYAQSIDEKQKLERKEKIINKFIENVASNYDSLFLTERYKMLGQAKIKINNASLASKMTYNLDLGLFYELHESRKKDLPTTISELKKLKELKKDHKKYIREVLLKKEPAQHDSF